MGYQFLNCRTRGLRQYTADLGKVEDMFAFPATVMTNCFKQGWGGGLGRCSVFDPSMLIVLPGLLLAMYAQFMVHTTFSSYTRVYSQRGMTGAQAAREILDSQGLNYVPVEMIDGQLTDHYDPRDKVLRLSPEVYRGSSIASLGVAAHEAGHALQHAHGYYPLNLRNSLVPVHQFRLHPGVSALDWSFISPA